MEYNKGMLKSTNLLKTKLSHLPLNKAKKDLLQAVKNAHDEIKILGSLPNDFSFVAALERVLFPIDQILAVPQATLNLYSGKDLEKLVELGNNQYLQLANKIAQNPILFKKLKSVPTNNLTDAEVNLIKSWTNAFIFSGSGLTSEKQKQLKTIDKQLIKLARQHENLINKDTYKKTLLIKIGDLAGIPAATIEDAKKTKQGYLFNDTHIDDLLSFSHNEKVRKQSYNVTKSVGKIPRTYKLILQINKLRQAKAKILGYTNYTELTLKQNLVKNTKILDKTVNQLANQLKPMANKWFKEVSSFQKKNGITIADYNYVYSHNQLMDKKINFNPQELKEYFSTKYVIKGMFTFLSEWTKLKFKPVKGFLPSYAVYQGKDLLGHLSLDLYARPNKNQGAWMDNLQPGGFGNLPWIVVATNFNQKDTKLSLDDVTTIFHEMGHALHGLLNNAFYPTQNGTGVSEEFVEFPSQFLENLIFTPKVLKLISRHSKTKKPMGKKELKLLNKYQNMGIAAQLYRQIYFQSLDQQFHRQKLNSKAQLLKMEQKLHKKMYNKNISAQYSALETFTHLTDNNYASNYYIYLWASLMEKDMFQTLGANLKWTDIAPLYQTRGASELETFLKLKGSSLNTKNFLRHYNLAR